MWQLSWAWQITTFTRLTIYIWKDYFSQSLFFWQVAEGLGKDCQLEHVLMFITGADRVPPLGFGKPITIAFYDQDGEKRRPSSSTCSLQLNLPRGEEDVNAFNELMVSALKESCGFGKV